MTTVTAPAGATAPAGPGSITEPGVYDIPAEVYHADPVKGGSLSSTGARRILGPKGCPALFQYEREHGTRPARHFDIGTAAHLLLLGVGPELVVIDRPDYRTKAAREERDEVHARGAVPLLAHEHEQVQAMAEALRAHPVAAALFAPGRGRAEQTLIWRDQRTGVMCRARPDWLPHPTPGRMLLPDYKTAAAVDLDSIQRSIATYGYHMQGEWYEDGVRALGLAEDVEFLLVFQMKDPPYLVTVVQLGQVAGLIAGDRNRQARETYRECTETGRWPGFSDAQPALVQLPAWLENTYLQERTR